MEAGPDCGGNIRLPGAGRSEGEIVERNVASYVSIALTIVFTIALYFASTSATFIMNMILVLFFPDYGIADQEISEAIIQSMMPIGLAMLAITVILIAVGFILKKGWLSVTGSIALYIPVFGAFSMAMFYLAGIGIVRVLWIPLIELAPAFFSLGHIVLIPLFLQLMLVWAFAGMGILGYIFMSLIWNLLTLIGIGIFMTGTMTWFLARFRGQSIANFGIYRYSRHPQYLGYLLWSYGLLLSAGGVPVAYGGLWIIPSLPWAVSLLIVLSVAVQEESQMSMRVEDEYTTYKGATPFLFPLPRRISDVLKAPIKIAFGKDWPEGGVQIASVAIFYLVIVILLSIPFALVFGS